MRNKCYICDTQYPLFAPQGGIVIADEKVSGTEQPEKEKSVVIRNLNPSDYYRFVELKGKFKADDWKQLVERILNYPFDPEKIEKVISATSPKAEPRGL
jgi:hypothetical protein